MKVVTRSNSNLLFGLYWQDSGFDHDSNYFVWIELETIFCSSSRLGTWYWALFTLIYHIFLERRAYTIILSLIFSIMFFLFPYIEILRRVEYCDSNIERVGLIVDNRNSYHSWCNSREKCEKPRWMKVDEFHDHTSFKSILLRSRWKVGTCYHLLCSGFCCYPLVILAVHI